MTSLTLLKKCCNQGLWLLFLAGVLLFDNPQVAYAVEQRLLVQEIYRERAALEHTYRVNVSDSQLAYYLKAEFHHALLAMDDDAGYLVLKLTPDDIDYLESLGLTITLATDYRARRQQQLDTVLARLNSPAAALSSSTIAPSVSQAAVHNGIAGYPCYATVEETIAEAHALVDASPDLAVMVDIGDSWNKVNSGGVEGYDLWVMKITNSDTDADFPDKPKLFIHSAMHAREYTTAALTLDFARLLLSNYISNADIQWIVDYHEIHILFHMNPDGRKIAEAGILKRKNNNTNHCGGSSGEGVDLNRNFSFFWNRGGFSEGYTYASGLECAETYRGPVPGSEPETQAVEAYVRSLYSDERGSNDTDPAPHGKPGLHLDIHSFSNLILYPYAHTNESAPNSNQLRRLARRLAYFNNYWPQPTPGLYLLDGNSESVSYGELGVAHLTYELGNTFFESCERYQQVILPDNLESLLHAAKLVAAPYALPDGPDFEAFSVKGRPHPEVTLGAPIEISATVSDALFNTLNGDETTQLIGRVEYSVDKHFSEADAIVQVLNPLTDSADGVFDSAEEILGWSLDNTQGQYAVGRHTLYLRAYDSDSNVGVVSARHFTIISHRYLEAFIDSHCQWNVCEFDASQSLDTDGNIVSYLWEFDDGSTSTAVNPWRVYMRSGEFPVALTVTATDGEKHRITSTITVDLEGTPPVADFTIECEGLYCQFDSTYSLDAENNIVLRRWFFGDGEVLGGETVDHLYSASGNYTVTLRLRDSAGWLIENSIELQLAPGVSSSYRLDPVKEGGEPDTLSGKSGGGGVFPPVLLLVLSLFIVLPSSLRRL